MLQAAAILQLYLDHWLWQLVSWPSSCLVHELFEICAQELEYLQGPDV